MSIRRLDPDTNMSGLPLMVPADDGGYVDYDDHLAEVERLREVRDRAEAVVKHIREMRIPMEGIMATRLIALAAALAGEGDE